VPEGYIGFVEEVPGALERQTAAEDSRIVSVVLRNALGVPQNADIIP
jgi:hypothetical protein